VDFGGVDRRKTKNDKKRKRLNRGYKRGGKFRTSEVSETSNEEKKDKMGKSIRSKKRKK
jgi:hypothetical protein